MAVDAWRVGKRIRHACGYQLWSYVLNVVGEMVVVNYRLNGAGEPGIVVSVCPQCRQALQLWWDDPTGEVVEAWRMEYQRLVDEALG